MCDKTSDIFLLLFCEKNSDGTKNLRLKGNELYQRKKTRLEARDMCKVSKFLTNNKNIVHLNLSYNNIGDKGLEILAREFFSHENNLVYLNIISCGIGFKGLRELYEQVENLKIQILRVNGNKLGHRGNGIAALLIRDCQSLQHLDLGDTDQTPDSVEMVTSVVARGNNIKILDMSRVISEKLMMRYDPAWLADSIVVMLQMNNSLVELHLQKCEFDGHDTELMLEGLCRNTTLLVLDLGYNQIACHGLECLSKWLRKRPNLLGLNVAGNHIKDAGARALSFAMPFSKLRLLDITSNEITDVGMAYILNSIKKPYPLRLFFIFGNKFGHKTNLILERLIMSGVLVQEFIDVKLYTVDGVIKHAYYQSNGYKHRYYCVMDHGCAVELKIKRNNVNEVSEPRDLVNFMYYPRYPPIKKENKNEIIKQQQ